MSQKPTKVKAKPFFCYGVNNPWLLWTLAPLIHPSHPSIHPSIQACMHSCFCLFAINVLFRKPIHFHPMHGMIVLTHWQAAYNQTKPNQTKPVFLTSLQSTTWPTLTGRRNTLPHFAFSFFFFVLCNRWWPQTNKFWVHDADFGWDIFFHHRSNLIGCLWHYQFTSSSVRFSSLVSNWMEGRKVMDDVLFRNFSMLP